MDKKIDFSKKDVVVLAPLAGYSDLPFRALAKKFGADFTVSEMISTNALVRDSKKTFKMIQKSPLENPYFVQLAGSDEKIFEESVKILNDIEGIDGIDLNCGCPVPKVVSQESGSALLKNLPKLSRLVEIIKKNSNKSYTTVKVRLGYSEKDPLNILRAAEEGGADFITVHGRTRAGAYKAAVDYEAIGTIKSFSKIPVIANGDIVSFEKAKWVKEFTNCDGIMIGRGAIGNPWIFYQIKNNLISIEKEKIKEIVEEHFSNMIDFYGDGAIAIFRKHLHLYSKSFPMAASFREKINKITNKEEMAKEIEYFFGNSHSCENTIST